MKKKMYLSESSFLNRVGASLFMLCKTKEGLVKEGILPSGNYLLCLLIVIW